MSALIQAAHYSEAELRISKDKRAVTLLLEYLSQGGTMEKLDENMLVINKQAHKRGIESAHIGAVVGAFAIIYKNLQADKKRLLNTSEAEGFTKEQVESLKAMAERGGYKFINLN